MRNKALLALLLLPALATPGCGENRARTSFDRYERSVEKVLVEEDDLRSRFGEKNEDALVYGKQPELLAMVKNEIRPFYRRMAEAVAAVKPEGKRLEEIHALLLQYVDLRRRLFDVYLEHQEEAEAAERREGSIQEALDRAQADIQKLGRKLGTLFQKGGAAADKLLPILRESDRVSYELGVRLAALREGTARAAPFLEALEKRVRPGYAKIEKDLASVEAGTAGAELLAAAREYVAGLRKLVDLGEKLGRARLLTEKKLLPLQERFKSLKEEGDEALKTYKEEARRYRDSLR